jgi:protein-tyrosine phosphatase
MAQAMLSGRLAARGVPVSVASAGLLAGGRRPPAEVISVMAARGIDVTGHRSRTVTVDDLAAADLILGLAKEHVRHAAVLLPEAWPRAFTLRELTRRGRRAGPRAPAEPLGDWVARAARNRDRHDLLAAGHADDVTDPAGGALRGYRVSAGLLDRLTRDLVDLGWPIQSSRGSRPGPFERRS